MDKITINLPGMDDFFTKEAYKVLRTNLQFCGQDVHAIAITSCIENEGKTVVSMQIAKSFSELGKRVLVVDADMRKSVMAGRNTDVRNCSGLSEVLTGLKPLNECVYATQFDNLHILFAGKYPPNPVELLNGKYFAALMEALRKAYDYIIIDTPPLGRVIDAAVIATKCDGTVLVLGDGRVHSKQAQEVLAQLRKSECRVLGAVRNKTRKKREGYYYRSRRYGYYGKSRYGYGAYGYGYGQQPSHHKHKKGKNKQEEAAEAVSAEDSNSSDSTKS